MEQLSYWSIFWRTFSQLASAGLLALGGLDLFTEVSAGATAIGLVLLSSAVGGLVAAGWAFRSSPAVSALDKAIRSAVEKLLGVIVLFTYNSIEDVVNNGRLLVASVT